MKTKKTARLIIAASEQNADLYWVTNFLAPDPVIYIEQGKKKFLILNQLELDRGKKEAQVDQVLSLEELSKKIPSSQKKSSLQVAALFLKEKGIHLIEVPQDFPALYLEELKKKRFKAKVHPDPFYPGRLIKTQKEKAAIKKSLYYTGKAIKEAYQVLRESKIKGDKIYWKGKVLTSEILRSVINVSLMKNNCLGKHTIVAGGQQAVDPHCEGSGPLKPHWPIIMDVFPKSMDTQYYADMTRTVVKGKASDAVKKQWRAVKRAQEWGIKNIKAGISGKKIHDHIHQDFESQGFSTGMQNGRMQGFFHGTGHGLGLDIHEAPRVSRVDQRLKAGHVVTVEPGLYYEKTGGVRIEDVVFVTPSGCEVLSSCPKIMEIA